MIDFSIGKVAAAYASNRGAAANLATPVKPPSLTSSPVGAAGAAAGTERSFAEFVGDQVKAAAETVRTSEKVSLDAVAGRASAQDVVQSVIAAEMTVQAVVAVRDKMVQAYQDIMRMAI
jgi:flagellar hook-basal body complex protein FliE